MARGKFTDKWSNVNMTSLESIMFFLQVKAPMTIRENLAIRSKIFVKRWEIAHTRLEAVASLDSPYSLIAYLKKAIYS